jgi:DNA-binding transcriptional LysR family regulator
MLRSAEQHSAIALVEHRGRRVQLTSAGAEVGRGARLVLAQLRGLDRLVEQLQAGKRGTLRLAATLTPSTYVLPPVIAEFKTLYPNVEVSLQVVAFGDWRMVLNEGPDLLVGTQSTPPVGWVAEALYRDPVTFFVVPDSPLARRASLGPGDLAAETVIAPWGRVFWTRVLAELRTSGIELERRMDVWPMPGVKHLVACGYGVGALLASAVREDLLAKRFVGLRIPGVDVAEPFYLIRPDVLYPPAHVDVFLRCLRKYVADPNP